MLGKGLSSLIPPKKQNLESGIKNHEKEIKSQESVNQIRESQKVFKEDKNITFDFLPSRTPQSFPRSEKTFTVNVPRGSLGKVSKPSSFSKSESVFQIETEKIKPNPYQPRRDFREEELRELSQSIREFGIIQPLIVSKIIKETEFGAEVHYQLIAGERRLLAAKILGLERVPAIVKDIDAERMKLEMALIENLQRSDLNPLEAARAYARLQDEFGLLQREIAVRVGKSREVIANTLRLLNLPLEIQEALRQGKINESQARTLLSINDAGEQKRVFENLLHQKMSVRALREEAIKPKIIDPEQNYWERRLEEKLGAPVKLIKQGDKGKVIVQFYSEEEYRALLDKLLGNSKEEI